jgi:antitoxin (DNA-binding transcriptional repressor) of toxin-antitoxin stability system
MNRTITAKELRASLPKVVGRVRRGARFTVIYRSRPAFQIVPVDAPPAAESGLEHDPLYHAKAIWRSTDGLQAADHDSVLYPK